MKLIQPKSNSTPSCVINQVRETPEIVQALKSEASQVGIFVPEAIRQIIRGYNRKPFAMKPGLSPGRKSAVFAAIDIDKATHDAFKEHCERHGVRVPEGIRQAVRRYLEKANG